MTIRYVGPGGNDGNNGTSWATRKLTLNGVEDTPVVAGDTVYVAPGVYRERLVEDVSGSAGSIITYIGDVTGEHTDGVGGIVRITGSDDDQTATRASAIIALGAARNYRTFRGFTMDTTTGAGIFQNSSFQHQHVVVEDCFFTMNSDNYGIALTSLAAGAGPITIRRCVFYMLAAHNIMITAAADQNNDILIENCLFIGGKNAAICSQNVGAIVVKNCTFVSAYYCIRIESSIGTATPITINNSLLMSTPATALSSPVLGEIVENYNLFKSNNTDRSNVAIGANSVTYFPLQQTPILQDNFRFPWQIFDPGKWSSIARIAGTGEATDDLFGLTRPVTASKKSWGAIQYTGAARETTTTYNNSEASLKIPDAGELFLTRVPIDSPVSTTVSLYVYREDDYTGTSPQMIIRQPGQSDRVSTDIGSTLSWNRLSDTFTPSGSPAWFDIFVSSNNTAGSGNYDVFVDSIGVS